MNIQSGDIVEHTSFGKGTVLKILNESAARIEFETSGIITVSTDSRHQLSKINNLPPMLRKSYSMSNQHERFEEYITNYERASRPWVLGWSKQTAWIVGFLLSNNARLRHSGQLNKNTKIETEDFEEASEKAHGEKFDVIVKNPNYPELDYLLDINFIHRSCENLSLVSLNKEGFFKFLLSIGFRDGRNKNQDSSLIRANVPKEYLEDFEAGFLGVVPVGEAADGENGIGEN